MAVAANTNPVANFSFSPATAKAGQNVFFNASLPIAANGREIVAWEWDFGDGAFGTGQTIAHIFGNPGTYNVVLKVTDSEGKIGTTTKSITVGGLLQEILQRVPVSGDDVQWAGLRFRVLDAAAHRPVVVELSVPDRQEEHA